MHCPENNLKTNNVPKAVHLIWWHDHSHRSIRDAKECVGVVTTGWQDADDVVARLNSEDDSKPLFGVNYWKEEIEVIYAQSSKQ